METKQNLNERRLADAWAELQTHANEGNPLHADAYRLAFVHPVTDKALEFQAQAPEDMRQALSSWGLGYNAP
eukprot:gene23720-44290_t